jgi:hypothetical protein
MAIKFALKDTASKSAPSEADKAPKAKVTVEADGEAGDTGSENDLFEANAAATKRKKKKF